MFAAAAALPMTRSLVACSCIAIGHYANRILSDGTEAHSAVVVMMPPSHCGLPYLDLPMKADDVNPRTDGDIGH